MECRVLKTKKCEITQYPSDKHLALDIVGENHTLDYIIAHSDGEIVTIQDGYDNMKGTRSYGNYIKLKHQDEYYTLYGHLQKGLKFKKGDFVKQGTVLGYMSDSGNAYGKHLHFEIYNKNNKINPLTYLNKDLPNNENNTLLYKLGDKVKINGVYISSTSANKLRPLITIGTITKIIENATNPYLLDDGKIGWVNDNVIEYKINEERYLENKTYQGVSIVDALNEINVDSSYKYRSELAKINNIDNYQGTAKQNTILLNLLKEGKLKY